MRHKKHPDLPAEKAGSVLASYFFNPYDEEVVLYSHIGFKYFYVDFEALARE